VGFLHPLKKVEYNEEFYAPFITPTGLPWFISPFVKDGRSFSSEWRFRRQLREILKLAPPPAGTRLKLLDIGCGMGAFIRTAAEIGIESWGVDVSRYAVQCGKERHPYPVESIDRLPELPGDFDVVTAWHVLEHTDDPVTFLRSALAHLRPGGLLVVEVPNWSAFTARLWKAQWRSVRIEHPLYFTKDALVHFLRRAGLEIRRTRHTGSWGLTPYFNRIYRWSGEAIKHWPLVLPVKAAYLNGMSMLRLGDFVRVFATKPR
jgi:SAM-dependent methyltransferase